MAAYRTDLADFVLDQLDFIECKLKEACDNPVSQKGAVIEAGGAVPQIRERLWSEDETKATQCLLAFSALVDRDAAAWWAKLAEMDREQFLLEVDGLLDPKAGGIAGVRAVPDGRDGFGGIRQRREIVHKLARDGDAGEAVLPNRAFGINAPRRALRRSRPGL